MKSGLNTRIANGKSAESPIPWHVGVRIKLDKEYVSNLTQGDTEQFCGGTILDEETILTAAHCFYRIEHEIGKYPPKAL